MSSIWLLVQEYVAIVGILWKAREGYPLLELPSLQAWWSHKYGWVELTGVSIDSIQDSWPWFCLHTFLYVGQLIPFTVIVLCEASQPLRTVAALAVSSCFCGFAAAMPLVSLWILGGRQHKQSQQWTSERRRLFLSSMLYLSAATHLGAFFVALMATWAPALMGSYAAPLHVMNSLAGVPRTAHGISAAAIREARLRQINEMTGTSSGFFMTAGLLGRTLESRGRRMTLRLLTWMFLVSLVAGPAAGGAAVILLRDFMERKLG
ncbi:hypothetical protein DCS_01701 [Drechmeria coniospora]|uniref:Uncharacterized protein n=1 Tax=Drechmeria coniospora TaxID=98403 RepID=A0A151GTW6_DRECN|nr:hypothetical protein DCS_01701 [Drechmeria coniospora]KYK60564.1 hypothetical protein DCS_01701 [Drechmeria coniospora]